jgi:L-aspartate oxidase
LLEGLVFGERTVRELNRYLAMADPAVRKVKLDLADEPRKGNAPAVVAKGREKLGQTMIDLCGVVRSGEGLSRAAESLSGLESSLESPGLDVEELELFNLLSVARQIVATAAVREESRGVHLRSDFSERDDIHWRRHTVVHRDAGTGELVVGRSEMETATSEGEG